MREADARDPDLSSCLRASELMSAGVVDAVSGEPCIAPHLVAGNPCLVADADVLLCSDSSAFDLLVHLTTSEVTFDCNNQVISHTTSFPERSAFRAPYERSVSDILITSCRIEYLGRYGIDLKRLFRGDELDGAMQGHERIRIEDVSIAHTSRVGIYVGQNSRGIVIERARIEDTFSGIYLEAGSKGTVVRDSEIFDSFNRAGIHIDSSEGNLVENTIFRGNQQGAIQLYKNCGEVHGQVCPIRRSSGASHNTIRDNDFYGNDVIVAYRQFKTYGPDWCAGISTLGHWRDRADNNSIVGNHFLYGAQLIVQDEDNHIVGNEFRESLLLMSAKDPLGDPSIALSGSIRHNAFDDDSWIGVLGGLSDALGAVRVEDNHHFSGGCVDGFRPKVACSGAVEDEMRGSCYGREEPIEHASCAAE